MGRRYRGVKLTKNRSNRRRGTYLTNPSASQLPDTLAVCDNSGVLIIPAWTKSSGISYCKHVRNSLTRLLDEGFCPVYTYAKHCSNVRFRNHHVEEWNKSWDRLREVAQALYDSGCVTSLAYRLKVKSSIVFKMAALFYLTDHDYATKLCLSMLGTSSVFHPYLWAGQNAGLVSLAIHIMSDSDCPPIASYPPIGQLHQFWDYREDLPADPDLVMPFVTDADCFPMNVELRHLVLALYDKWLLDHNRALLVIKHQS